MLRNPIAVANPFARAMVGTAMIFPLHFNSTGRFLVLGRDSLIQMGKGYQPMIEIIQDFPTFFVCGLEHVLRLSKWYRRRHLPAESDCANPLVQISELLRLPARSFPGLFNHNPTARFRAVVFLVRLLYDLPIVHVTFARSNQADFSACSKGSAYVVRTNLACSIKSDTR